MFEFYKFRDFYIMVIYDMVFYYFLFKNDGYIKMFLDYFVY